jgi:hypothetical protein
MEAGEASLRMQAGGYGHVEANGRDQIADLRPPARRCDADLSRLGDPARPRMVQ